MIRLLFVRIVGSFLVSGMRPFLGRGGEDRCESVLVETFVWMKGLGFFIIYNTLYSYSEISRAVCSFLY